MIAYALQQEVRTQARDIVTYGMTDVLEWLNGGPGYLRSTPTQIFLWVTGAKCLHTFEPDGGYCFTCGFCFHRKVQREFEYDSAWCLDCGEDRPMSKWR